MSSAWLADRVPATYSGTVSRGVFNLAGWGAAPTGRTGTAIYHAGATPGA
jgi:hypothetical protein